MFEGSASLSFFRDNRRYHRAPLPPEAPLMKPYILIGLLTFCIAMAAFFKEQVCRQLQKQFPLKWAEIDPRWIAPDVDEEGAQIRAQFRFLRFLVSGEYRKLEDERLAKHALLFKVFG